MNILILADIHSNLEALKEVFNYLKLNEIKIEKIIVLGDLIGYGPFPNQVINFIKLLNNVEVIAGNHEWAVCGKININYFNENAKLAIEWTKNILTSENFEYILNLPVLLNLEFNGIKYLFVHGSPVNKIEQYILNDTIAAQSFNAFNDDVCFFAHTHIPYIYFKSGNKITSLYLSENLPVELKNGYRYLINPGSVGQPRDGDFRASFGILDTNSKIFRIKRIEYNYKVTQTHIINNGLPPFLASRLAWGR